MSKENDKILNYVQGQKSIKAPFIIYADTDCYFLRGKVHVCKNDPVNFSTTTVSEHTASGYSALIE